jgi:hypothetical protein
MSKFDDVLASYTDDAKKLGIDLGLLAKVTKGLGPSIYNADSSKVSGADQAEIDRVKTNFLGKKLGITDEAAMDSAIAEVIEAYGKSNPNKHRAVVYALLVMKFKKESVYA